MRIATIVTLLACMLAVTTAPGATAVRPPGLILFTTLAAKPALGVIRPNGKGRRILTHKYYFGSWSPSGRRILAYGGKTNLAILDDRGHLVRALKMRGGSPTGLTWSPHGSWLAGATHHCPPPRPYCDDLRIMRTDGSKERKLASVGALGGYAWAPGGGSLAYTERSDASPLKGIVIVSLSGQKITRPAFQNGGDPTWAPDGRRLAFARDGQIYAVRRDGSELTQLTHDGTFSQPSWSPDGRRIAYHRLVHACCGLGDYLALDVRDLRDSQVTEVADCCYQDDLVWSPDGTRLAWRDTYTEEEYVFVARADGSSGDPVPLTPGVNPDWR